MGDERRGGLSETTTTARVARTKKATTELKRPQTKGQIIIISGPGAGRRYPIEAEGLVIGRNPASQVWLPEDSVSRNHARISPTAQGRPLIADLQTRNGTFVNGLEIEEKTLEIGDKISIGETLMVFTLANPLEEQMLQVQKMEAVGRMAAGVAHEFNNLLSAILSNLTLVASGGGNLPADEREQCIIEAMEAARRGAELTDQMLNFSRSREAELALVDVSKLAEEVTRFARRSVPTRIDLSLQSEPELYVKGDRVQLYQALVNLCLNARDAIEQRGTIVLRVRRGRPRDLPANSNIDGPGVVVVEVADNGLGMSEDVRARAFEPFFTTKGVGSGTGLGLSVVHGIARGHGGDVSLRDAPGGGTVVSIWLPAIEPATAPPQRSRPLAPGEACLAGTVLLVDDDPLVLSATRRLLRSLGLAVFTAEDGKSAIRCFEQHRDAIDVVLLDMMMPVLDGAETLALFRRLAPDLPVIMVTGYSGEDGRKEELLAGGARAVLRKPIELATLQEELLSALAD